MKKKAKGLLIYPPIQLMDIETPRPDGSLGPLYLAATLESIGFQTDILDASVGPENSNLKDSFDRSVLQDNGLIRIGMNFDEITEYVCEGEYDFIGIHSNFTPQTKMVFKIAEAIKMAASNVAVFAGGVNARALKDRFLKSNNFDGICLTEGELIFPKMVEVFSKGKSLHNIAGVAFKEDNKIIENKVTSDCFPSHLDHLKMPSWEKMPFKQYEKIASPHGVDVTNRKSRRYAPIMTSRGCPFKCSYCHISLEKKDYDLTGSIGNLRCHSINRVVEEICRLKSLGVERLFFEDDSLLAHKDRVKEIFKRVKNDGLLISNVNGVNLIHFYNTKDRTKWINGKWDIDIEYLEILKDAGFDQIVFPVESASKRILKKYATNKTNLDRMDLVLLMNKMTELGIKAPVNMMIGFPDESEEEIKQSIEFSKKLMEAGAPYITFFIPIPFPGSKLFEIAISGGYLDENFNPDLMNWKNPIMKNTTVPPYKLIEIRDRANEEVNNNDFLEKRFKESAAHRLSV